jgi:hypothetical protein
MGLLSTRNHAFSKFMTHVIRLKMNYPEYWIKNELLSMMAGKLIGMTSLSYPLTYVQRRLNYKFRNFRVTTNW